MLKLLILSSLISLVFGETYYKRTIPYNHPEEVNWPLDEYDLGQITGIDVHDGNVLVFHRGTVVWDASSFNDSNHFQNAELGPIEEDTIVLLDSERGKLLTSFGSGIFYMPHGLSVDGNGSVWVTDVALHQVFKFPAGSTIPSLILGQRFAPGSSPTQFCQPTDVAVSSSGVVFVSDGYCNSRVLKFDRDGKTVGSFGEEGWLWKEGKGSSLAIPHSLTLIEDEDCICIADREHRRVLCVNAGLEDEKKFGEVKTIVKGGEVGRVFAVAFDGNERLFAINGASSYPAKTQGLTIDLKNGAQVLDTWTSHRSFISPHDLAVDGQNGFIYVAEIGPNRLTQFKI